jgi:transcriptional regulator of acetoin/glycerol metabolism
VNVCDGNRIQLEHLPAYIVENSVADDAIDPMEDLATLVKPLIRTEGNEVRWPDAERRMIMDAMVKSQGRKSEAAQALGYCRSTLWRKMKKYGIIE